jgi:hypothetical protein
MLEIIEKICQEQMASKAVNLVQLNIPYILSLYLHQLLDSSSESSSSHHPYSELEEVVQDPQSNPAQLSPLIVCRLGLPWLDENTELCHHEPQKNRHCELLLKQCARV